MATSRSDLRSVRKASQQSGTGLVMWPKLKICFGVGLEMRDKWSCLEWTDRFDVRNRSPLITDNERLGTRHRLASTVDDYRWSGIKDRHRLGQRSLKTDNDGALRSSCNGTALSAPPESPIRRSPSHDIEIYGRHTRRQLCLVADRHSFAVRFSSKCSPMTGNDGPLVMMCSHSR